MNDYKKEFERFLQEQKKLSEGTRAFYLGDYRKLVAFAQRQRIEDLADMSAGDLNAFVRWLNGQEKSPATVNRSIAAVRCFFSALQSYGIVQKNPAEWMVGQKIARREPQQPVCEDAFEKMVKAICPDYPSCARDLAMIVLLRETGVRINDLLQMNVQDVETETNSFLCGEERKKLTPSSAEKIQNYLVLRERLQHHTSEPALFLNQYGKRMSRQGFWKQLKKYAAEAGVSQSITPGSLFMKIL